MLAMLLRKVLYGGYPPRVGKASPRSRTEFVGNERSTSQSIISSGLCPHKSALKRTLKALVA